MSAVSRAARIARLLPAFASIAVLAAMSQSARADYPERQITMIVCFPAGGGTDIAARLINTQLGDALGKPVIIENRGGAGGNIGIAAAARAGGDGHTLLVCSSACLVNRALRPGHLRSIQGLRPGDGDRRIAQCLRGPGAVEIKSMPEFLAKAKANPGKLNWTSPGAGTTPHLAGEGAQAAHRHEMQHIPVPGRGAGDDRRARQPG